MTTLIIQKLSNPSLAPKYTQLVQKSRPGHVVIDRDDFIMFKLYIVEIAQLLGVPEEAKWMYEQIERVEMKNSRDERREVIISPSKQASLCAFVEWYVALSKTLPLMPRAASAAEAIRLLVERKEENEE